ncbi:MAG: serine hydrolase domain-containing protein [Gemmatimonadota bacterium]
MLMMSGVVATLLLLQGPVPQAPGVCGSDTAAVSTFFHQFMSTLPPALKVPRASFVLVCGGHPAYATGYGKTAAGDDVDPARTIFRAASNGKLVVATSALQLAERGMWRLSDDVNQYLPEAARLENGSFQHPVTIDALLTHTAGFENRMAGSVALPADRVTLAEFFSRPPHRVVAPGVEVSYSNVGIALAGYLVEIRAGKPFSQYAADEIFVPLGMSRSSFDQPPPADWTSDLADGPPDRSRNVVFNPYPAGSLVTTPLDMGRFIAAHLNGGALDSTAGGGRVLATSTIALMHASHWRADPSVPGVAYGFFEGEINGHRTLFHTGDSGDHSVVFLLPDDGAGFYLVFTGSDEQTALREQFTAHFMDRFFPNAAAEVVSPPVPASLPVTQLSGVYRTAAYSRSNFEKLQAIFAQVRVRPGERGGIALTPPGASSPIQLRPAGGVTFRGDSGEVVAFRRDSSGRVVGLMVSGSIWDPGSWDRIGPLEDGRLHLLLLAGIALVSLLRIMVWPAIALVQRSRQTRAPRTPEERKWWRWSAVAPALLLLAPISALGTAFLSFTHPLRAIPRAVTVLEVVLVMATISGILLLLPAIRAWRYGWLSPARRVHLTLLAAAFVLLAPFLYYWRLLPV